MLRNMSAMEQKKKKMIERNDEAKYPQHVAGQPIPPIYRQSEQAHIICAVYLQRYF